MDEEDPRFSNRPDDDDDPRDAEHKAEASLPAEGEGDGLWNRPSMLAQMEDERDRMEDKLVQQVRAPRLPQWTARAGGRAQLPGVGHAWLHDEAWSGAEEGDGHVRLGVADLTAVVGTCSGCWGSNESDWQLRSW